jgi:hypothetical protein
MRGEHYDFSPTLEEFLLKVRPEDAYTENRVGMSKTERLYEQLFHKKPVEAEPQKLAA